MPDISIIISTYNDEAYIKSAVDSILEQTFTNFELIVVNDGSTDQTAEILNSIKDSRILLITNSKKMGIAYSRNKALSVAKGQYIVQMDGDDISLPKRLEMQYKYMEAHKDISICGTNMKCFGKENSVTSLPEDEERLKCILLFYSPLPHSSWMMRRSDIEKYGLYYDESFKTSLDYELMYRSINRYKIACIQDVLVRYRVHSKSITGQTVGIDKNMIRVQNRLLKRLHIPATKRNIVLLNQYCNLTGANAYIDFVFLMHRIRKQNKRYKLFDQKALKSELNDRIIKECKRRFGIL